MYEPKPYDSLTDEIRSIAWRALMGIYREGNGAAGVAIVKTQPGLSEIFAAEAAAHDLGVAFVKRQVTSDMVTGDLATLVASGSGEFVPRTVFDNCPNGGILLLSEADLLKDCLVRDLANAVDGDVSHIPALRGVDLRKWFFIMAASEPERLPEVIKARALAFIDVQDQGPPRP